jgi:hypothetical protein
MITNERGVLEPTAAVAGLPPVDYGMRITVTGPGMVVTGSLSVANVTNFGLFNDEPTITLTPAPEGNYAEFMGWTGALHHHAGTGPKHRVPVGRSPLRATGRSGGGAG